MTNIIQIIESIVGSFPLLFIITTISCLLKGYILFGLGTKKISLSSRFPHFLLMSILISSIVVDSAWILKLIQILFFPGIDYRFVLMWLRIAWGFNAIQYLALGLFLESLVEQNFKTKLRHKIFIFFTTLFFLFFVGLALFGFSTHKSRPSIEFTMLWLETIYIFIPLIISGIIIHTDRLKSLTLPRILTKQFKLLITCVIAPYCLFDFLQIFPYNIVPNNITNSYAFVGIANILLTYAIYYCSRRIMGLRFLNFQEHVQSPVITKSMDGLKTVLEQFSHVTHMHELGYITQTFFKESFRVPLNKSMLSIRSSQSKIPHEGHTNSSDTTMSLIETFMTTHEHEVCDYIQRHKILIYDEIAFSNFYEETNASAIIISFMNAINADIFLPIYEKKKLIAYIVIDRFARHDEFYSNVERDEMIVFASYLGNIINLLQTRSVDGLVEREQELTHELYLKHQEINQYKESIRSFIHSNKERAIGILFYKNRRFAFGNQAAQELIQINPNQQEGHPLSKALKSVAQQVETYKAPCKRLAKDARGSVLVISGVTNLEHTHIIITVYYPEIADIIKNQIESLQDPSEWDYLLYLETTKTGKLINQLIPGSGQTLLNFKIELLKTALHKKAIFLDIPEEDLMPTVELLHHVSLRETLHVMELRGRATHPETAIKLFGINPIFDATEREKPLLEKLDGTGTLFIKNIHFLNRETQDYLSDFIRYGSFRTFKSDHKTTANVRIICSSSQSLQHLVQEGKFSGELFDELKCTTLSMPSLVGLPMDELGTLADGFSEQAIKNQTFKTLLELTERDKSKIVHKRPVSLQELKKSVQQTLIHKSKQTPVEHETHFDPAYDITDPELVQAARLGKHALKDRKLMILLWHKFKNQNKIATFLGVNRSSVNRRCKAYELE